jgi:2'-5' RNA ligase
MLRSALIVNVAEAEGLVSELRGRYDPSATDGVPAHITILFPFREPTAISSDDILTLKRTFLSHPSFAFSLTEIGRWPRTTFLTPKPVEPFIELTNAVAGAFPSYPLYEGKYESVIPHLTVADGSAHGAAEAEARLRVLLREHVPVLARCNEIELIEDISGIWKLRHRFQLASSAA